jgi:hypothetical protein
MKEFKEMTKDEALEYCYKHEDKFVSACNEDGQRQFDCLIEILDSETIKPEQITLYGMNFEESHNE